MDSTSESRDQGVNTGDVVRNDGGKTNGGSFNERRRKESCRF